MRIAWNNLAGGELSPKMAGRGDIVGTHGAARLRNFFVRVTGGIFRKPGNLFSWAAKSDTVVPRLMPFNFSASDALLLEFGDLVLRFGQSDALIGAPLEVTTPWTESELQALRHRQVNDVVYLAHPNHAPHRLTRLANDSWELEDIHEIIAAQDPEDGFPWPAFMDENAGLKTLTVTGDISTLGGAVTIEASGDVFETGHEGAFFQVAHRRDNAFTELFIPVFPAASATMDLRVQPIEGQQFTIEGSIYTWKASANISGAYQIPIGADVETSRDNAVNAINGDADPSSGAAPGPGTAQNPNVEAHRQEITASNQAAQGILTGDGTNRLAQPNLAGPANVRITIGSIIYGFIANPVQSTFGATYNVKMGATEKESLNNLVKAINASGTNGTEYYGPSGVTAHADVTAALTADNQITVTAKTGGTAGNSIATTVNDTSAAPEPLNWGAVTLTAGGGETSHRLRVDAREVGTDGNAITVGGMLIGVLLSNNTLVANNDTVTCGGKTYRFRDVNNVLGGGAQAFTQANDVLIGANADATLQSLIHAINLTGTPGTDYEATTTINAGVFAGSAPTALHQMVVASKAIGQTTNLDTTDTTATAADLAWGAATLQPVWNSPTLTGGADADVSSDGFEVLGSYKIFSYGIWQGTVILERENSDGTWEPLRQWRGHNDRNIAESGIAEFPQTLRLRVVDGTGTTSADVDRPRWVVEADDAKIFGIFRVVTVTDATHATGTIVRPVFSEDATRNWSEGAWSDYRGYPSALTIHNQRLMFAGTASQPQTLWSSATGDFQNFRRGLNDADGFQFTLAADDSSPVLWMQSLGAGIIIGKEGSEWLATSSDGATSVTPTNFQAKKQSAYGSSGADPVIVGPRILFPKFGGRTILEYVYAYDEQAFSAVDMTEASDHLFRGEVKQMAFSRNPEDIVFIVTHDGRLISMHYKKEKQFLAYAYHESDAYYESVACVNGPGDVDHVYFAVRRTINGSTRRFIERLDLDTFLTADSDTIDEAATRSQLCYLDCAVRVTGALTTSATGFGHLEGETIALWVDGTRHAPKTVVGGAVALDRPASTVLGGIDFSDTTVVSVFPTELTQPPGTTQGKKYKAGEILARVYQTTAFEAADSPTSEFFPAKILEATDEVNAPHPAVSKIVRCCGAPRWQDDIRTTIRATGAEPLAILCLVADVEVSG